MAWVTTSNLHYLNIMLIRFKTFKNIVGNGKLFAEQLKSFNDT